MREYRIAVVPGDGIGKEVVPEGMRLLAAVEKRIGGFHCAGTEFPWGSDYYRKHGVMMPEDGNETLKPFDAILFGAVGDPELPDHLTLWGLRLKICQGFDQYANVRPTRIFPGIATPLANPARRHRLGDRAREHRRRVFRCRRARASRPAERSGDRGLGLHAQPASSASCASPSSWRSRARASMLTVITKSNAQRHGMVMWDEIAARNRRGISRT